MHAYNIIDNKNTNQNEWGTENTMNEICLSMVWKQKSIETNSFIKN